MSEAPIIATPDEIVRPWIDTLVAKRPLALQHINYGAGVWSHVVAGTHAQAALTLGRLASAAASNRLSLSTGTDLVQLLDSEFDANISTAPTISYGEVQIHRAAGGFPPGVIRKGTQFVRAADPNASPIPTLGGSYITMDDFYVAAGVQTVTLPVQAISPGIAANHLKRTPNLAISIGTSLFDSNFSAVIVQAAGGSDVVSDAYLRATASAIARGQYGPVEQSVVAGCLLAGARHVAVATDTIHGVLFAFVADASWCGSTTWTSRILQSLVDNEFIGFGCNVIVVPVGTQFIHVDATVSLRDRRYLSDTSDVMGAVQNSIRGYFDDRLDWYTWSLAGLRAAVSRAHPKILTCASAAVTAFPSESIIPEPPSSIFYIPNPPPPSHYYLADNSLTATFVAPP